MAAGDVSSREGAGQKVDDAVKIISIRAWQCN